jgi:hypothetical protein
MRSRRLHHRPRVRRNIDISGSYDPWNDGFFPYPNTVYDEGSFDASFPWCDGCSDGKSTDASKQGGDAT